MTSGPQVVPGYWNKPDKTAESMPDGAIMTGDVGFMDADGWFWHRRPQEGHDQRLGYKVWPREVEDVIYAHPAVRGVRGDRSARRIPRGNREGVRLAERGGVGDRERTGRVLQQQMAAYKYPRQVVIVEELPKTVTGKILRRTLRAGK